MNLDAIFEMWQKWLDELHALNMKPQWTDREQERIVTLNKCCADLNEAMKKIEALRFPESAKAYVCEEIIQDLNGMADL